MDRRTFLKTCGAAGMASLAGPWAWAADASKPLRFVAINDLHVLGEGTERIVARAVEQINALEDIAFTVVVGDLGSLGAEGEMRLAKQALDGLEQPYFCVPGNHDFAPKTDDGYVHYDAFFDTQQWHAERPEDGWAFIGLNTCNEMKSDVTVPPERLAWLAEQIAAVPKEMPIALFGHHPFNPHTKAYRVRNADEIIAMFAEHNLRLVISGHYHGNQVEERDGITFVTNACCSTTRGNFDKTEERGFRCYDLHGSDFTHEFVVVPHADLLA
ncbi:MAG: twin-arginine translocation signal domain-containing protein [Candidatus Hydrogenedens sp.]|nr:twin-arginine translocation signal domain-containing protein [Candidatus Hydrogenedens sp.]